jgi:hypothetical protein
MSADTAALPAAPGPRTAATMIALLVVARLAFSVAFPRQPAEFALAVVLGALALLSLGLLLASVLPTSRDANAAGAILFFPMMFFAGLWLPIARCRPHCATSARPPRSARRSTLWPTAGKATGIRFTC